MWQAIADDKLLYGDSIVTIDPVVSNAIAIHYVRPAAYVSATIKAQKITQLLIIYTIMLSTFLS